VADGLSEVRARIREAAERSGRDPAKVRLVGISKYASADAVRAAYDAGLRDFGENRAAELEARAKSMPSDVRWHFVGRLQRNKVRIVRPLVILLHSLDREELCAVWAKGANPPPVLVQVNLAGESQKGGVPPDRAEALVEAAESLGVSVGGLMTMPPLHPDPEASRQWFAALRRLRDTIRERHPEVVELSMGMTSDYPVAVEEGATILRVGRAIFDWSHDEG
jgi:PLP dependent protein